MTFNFLYSKRGGAGGGQSSINKTVVRVYFLIILINLRLVYFIMVTAIRTVFRRPTDRLRTPPSSALPGRSSDLLRQRIKNSSACVMALIYTSHTHLPLELNRGFAAVYTSPHELFTRCSSTRHCPADRAVS